MPRIRTLDIREEGPIRSLRLVLAPGMNILTDRGGGGTGKTTILNCAAAAANARYRGRDMYDVAGLTGDRSTPPVGDRADERRDLRTGSGARKVFGSQSSVGCD